MPKNFLIPGYTYSNGKIEQTDIDRNGEEGKGSVSISTYKNRNNESGDCNQKFWAFLDFEEDIVFNINEYDLCQTCKKLYKYINNIERDLKECNEEKRILISTYGDKINKCKQSCVGELKHSGITVSHFESADELTSETEKPSTERKNQIESKKEDVTANSESHPQTSETVVLETGKTQDGTSKKSLRETENQQHENSVSQHVVNSTSESNENESKVTESLDGNHPSSSAQKETTEQSGCVSGNPTNGESYDRGCSPARMSSQAYDLGDEPSENPLDRSLTLCNLPNSQCDTGDADKTKDFSPPTVVTRNSDGASVQHKEHSLTAVGAEDSVQSSTHEGGAIEVGAPGTDNGGTYTTGSYDDATPASITASDHGTSSDIPTVYEPLDNKTTQVGGSRSEGAHTGSSTLKNPHGKAEDEKNIHAECDCRNNGDIEISVAGTAGNKDSSDECAKNRCLQGEVPLTATNEKLSSVQQNSDGSSISSSTHTLSGSSGNNTVNGIKGVRGSNSTVNNGVTEKGIVQDGSVDNEQEIPYKYYIIIIVVPLSIILLMALLVKFTPLGTFFRKKKIKKRKQMNEKLQKVLLDHTPTTEKRVHLAYSYS